ncbi:hypothetical protein SEA_ANNADREAMY_195 [Streptomyces phage Annadreamy]|uniref:Uncharacterized protein n=2 Tax=Annadreamyvirus annadreamy TaxID=2846392 RepID=A0A345GTK8_9CAUD|nr:hypothetical protein HWB75_gp083 [Streptomyces phage Annadreamy]AXG66280.1 hypothetical protein SEA_ANNADREAMY_195 [Streptomyces phage Annadreamy]QGH79503.1 hypothetical protein SEA_LIMPID_202 [Streptomyces phage Limpid]
MTFYQELKRALTSFMQKNTSAGDVDMVLNTIEKTFVHHFVFDINLYLHPKKKNRKSKKYSAGYRDALADMTKYYEENYVQRRHSSMDH